MPANTAPIFTLTPAVEWAHNVTAANTTSDGTSGTIYYVFTGGTNGSYLQKIRFRHTGTNSSATVARVWINNGSANTVAANNSLYDEITIAANTVSQTAAATNYELPLNFAINGGYTVFVTIGTAAAGGIDVTLIGGDY